MLVSRKRSTHETMIKVDEGIVNCVFIFFIASVNSYSEGDDGVTASGSGLSMQEVNQALTRSSLHSVKDPIEKNNC